MNIKELHEFTEASEWVNKQGGEVQVCRNEIYVRIGGQSKSASSLDQFFFIVHGMKLMQAKANETYAR